MIYMNVCVCGGVYAPTHPHIGNESSSPGQLHTVGYISAPKRSPSKVPLPKAESIWPASAHIGAFTYQGRKDERKREFLLSLLLIEGLSTDTWLNSEEELDESHLGKGSSYKCQRLGSTPNLLNLESHLF